MENFHKPKNHILTKNLSLEVKILLFGKVLNPGNPFGIVHGVKADLDGTLNALQ